MIVPYDEARSIVGGGDCARLWNSFPRLSAQARLHPGMPSATPILASHLLSQPDVCPWHFAAVLVPSPPFLDKRCKSARPHPTRHPLPLLYGPINGLGNVE